ncbi:Na/Pi cotransporter family protein [Octadecabacter sp.]|nr:Na/Pi cotransporter family protein [Octadecabacter sp.]
MLLLIELVGAIGLLLFGLRQVRNGMMRAFGSSLKRLAGRTEGHVIPTFLAGVLVAVLLQSSAATAMISATFAAQGAISAATAFITVLGADVGTAIAALIASQKITAISPLLIAAGYFGGQLARTPRTIGLFKSTLGVGLVLLGLSLVGKTALRISELEDFATILGIFAKQPLLVLILGAGISYLAHSSLAVILLTVGLANAGVLDLQASLFMVLGANVGSGVLPVIAHLQSSAPARIPLLANLYVRLVGVAIAAVLIMLVSPLPQLGFSVTMLPLLLHLALNIAVALIGIIGAQFWVAVATASVTADTGDTDDVRPIHLDPNAHETPSRALACAKREALRMADIAQTMVQNIGPILKSSELGLLQKTSVMDDGLDTLFDAIKIYMAKTMQEQLSGLESEQAQDLLTFIANMEHIGDIVDCDILPLSGKKSKRQVDFSQEGLAEITEIHKAICINFDLAVNAFLTYDPELARQLYDTKMSVSQMEDNSISAHIDRIGSGRSDSIESSDLHLDMLHGFKRINEHLTTTAHLVLNATGETQPVS